MRDRWGPPQQTGRAGQPAGRPAQTDAAWSEAAGDEAAGQPAGRGAGAGVGAGRDVAGYGGPSRLRRSNRVAHFCCRLMLPAACLEESLVALVEVGASLAAADAHLHGRVEGQNRAHWKARQADCGSCGEQGVAWHGMPVHQQPQAALHPTNVHCHTCSRRHAAANMRQANMHRSTQLSSAPQYCSAPCRRGA